MKKIIIIFVILIISFSGFVFAYSQENFFTDQQFEGTGASDQKEIIKSFELRFDNTYFEPPVIVVNEGETVELTFMFRDDHYVSIGPYVNDYFNVGYAKFKPSRGEYTVECRDCDVKAAGFLVVQ